jgi:DNA anti-recombination protein RmuC
MISSDESAAEKGFQDDKAADNPLPERRKMSELEDAPRSYSGAILAVIALALLCALGGLIWSYMLSGRLAHNEAALAEANQQNVKLAAELRETDARLKVTADELGKSLGLTQKQMDARAQQIIAHEAAENKRLETAQKATAQQVTAVSSDLTSVKTDVGGVKTDVAKTQTDLAGAITQLQSIKGDLSDHSSLIARNHDELEILKHKGDRNYFEFTLNKGDKKAVGTVSLELKKTDAKKSKFTVVIYADDKRYEKKDRNVNEPLQFYSGKDPGLYEIVVNSITSKNQIAGYLSTPKTAAAPPSGQ